MERKEQLLEAVFGTMRSKQEVTVTSRRPHIATSGQQCRSQQFSNVATSPRHDVTTSRRQLENLHLIIKCQTARNLGHRGAYEQRHGFPEPEDPDFERVPGICTAFHFVRYYLGYDDDVFDTKHFVLFVHDVLDLFLGLHQTLSQTMD